MLALVVALVALGGSRRAASRQRRPYRRRKSAHELPADVKVLRDEVQTLRHESDEALRHLAVVRYDAFGDMGGRLSWSLALLDVGGNGVVLTSIHGRSDARTYAKNISGWSCEQQLSPEEQESIDLARTD